MISNLLTPTFKTIPSIIPGTLGIFVMKNLLENMKLLYIMISDILPETIHEKRTKHKMLLSMMMKKYSMKVSC